MRRSPRVSVVIVTYESRSEIGECLKSLREHAADWLLEIIVVDNASRDGTAKLVRQLDPGALVVENEMNIGFGRAMNRGVSLTVGEYILLLNPDCTIQSDAIDQLVAFLESRLQAGACGPMLSSPGGDFQYSSRRGFPNPLNSVGYMTGLDRLFPRHRKLGGYQQRFRNPLTEGMAEAISGACMLVRRSAFNRVGAFDEDYFLFGEDIDLCWKFWEAGYEIWYIPAAKIRHTKGASMRQSPKRAGAEFYRSMELFVDKRLRQRYSPMTLWAVRSGISLARLLDRR